MNKLTLIFLVCISLVPNSYSQREVSGGGDTVECKKKEGAKYVGKFNLDFLATLNDATQEVELVQSTNLKESLDRIRDLLLTKHAMLGASFELFLELLRAKNRDPNHPWHWMDAAFGLVTIPSTDPQYDWLTKVKKLPPNCYDKTGIRLIRTTTVSGQPGHLKYETDFDEIQSHKDHYQTSFHWVHEWLRTFTDNAKLIAELNWLFHSSLLNDYSDEDLKSSLAKKDFRIHGRKSGFVPVDERSIGIQDYLGKALSTSPEDLSGKELLDVNEIDLSNVEPFVLQQGDLSGLNKLYRFKAPEILLEYIPYGFFFDVPSLYYVSLSGNKIKKIRSRDFLKQRTKPYFQLEIANNLVHHIDSGTFSNIFRYEDDYWRQLNLENNQIREISDNLFIGSKIQKINLKKNPIATIFDSAFRGVKGITLSIGVAPSFELQENAFRHSDIETVQFSFGKKEVNAEGKPIPSFQNESIIQEGAFQLAGFHSLRFWNADQIGIRRIRKGAFKALTLKFILVIHGGDKPLDVEAGAFEKASIPRIRINRTAMSLVRAKTFTDIRTLWDLDLSKNKIRTIEEGSLSGVRISSASNYSKIDLSNNEITKIVGRPFKVLEDGDMYPLEVDLSHNQLRTLPIGFMIDSSAWDDFLCHLDLSHNRLTHLPKELVAAIKEALQNGEKTPQCKRHQPTTIDLTGNQFNDEWKTWLQGRFGKHLKI